MKLQVLCVKCGWQGYIPLILLLGKLLNILESNKVWGGFICEKCRKEQMLTVETLDTIDTVQIERLFAIAQGDADVIRKILNNYNYTRPKDMRKTDYEAICKEVNVLVDIENRNREFI